MQVFVFGDSIVYGSWDSEGGWVDRLKKDIHKKVIDSHKEDTDCYFQIYNLGISGNTTKDLINRFEAEINPRLNEEEENFIIFAIGINDSQFRHNEGDHKVPFKEYQENLEKLLEMAKRYSERICFVGLTLVNEKKTDPLEWDKTESYKNEFIKKYDQELQDFCQKNNLAYIPVPEMTEDLLEDGLHPNSFGHEEIYKRIKETLTSSIKIF
jgi:lysophospholipase L1-like esterase